MFEHSSIPAQELRELAQSLVDAESPNPPGDVSRPIEVAASYLDRNGLVFSRISNDPSHREVNLVARVFGGKPGPHLVLNAHLDVFPTSESRTSDRSELTDIAKSSEDLEHVRGRGAVDMKGGAAVFMVVLKMLNERRHELQGMVSLCLVCDEETFGPNGSRALLRLFPELSGDALLSTEPSSLSVVRVGERGFIWGTVKFFGKGGHGAYPGSADSPIEKAASFVQALRDSIPEDWGELDAENSPTLSQNLLAPKGKSFVDSVSLNFGTIGGGIKVNMQPDNCSLEVDVRIPIGQRTKDVEMIVRDIATRCGGAFNLDNSGEPNRSDETDPFFEIVREAVNEVTGSLPSFAVGLGCTDTRLWRYLDVPAAVYGPDPSTMAKCDEIVALDDLVKIADVHFRTACKYLSQSD